MTDPINPLDLAVKACHYNDIVRLLNAGGRVERTQNGYRVSCDGVFVESSDLSAALDGFNWKTNPARNAV